ncbi:MAG: SapC family protein [Litoreibacter sp.]|nr:SapC family protein [Litoreibacter sp.]
MVRRRAVDPEDRAPSSDKLPLLYRTLVPLTPERHQATRLQERQDYGFAASANVIPLTVDEFPVAMRHYPIVLAPGAPATPVALVGFERGKNAYVDENGQWAEGAYIPAYVRRYPFGLVRESETAERHILCADMSSTLLGEGDEGQPLFNEDGSPSDAAKRALDFCQRYTASTERTRAVMQEAQDLDLIGPSEVTISRGDRKQKVDGFALISEEKFRALDDGKLADLVRRGVSTIYAAHQMSLANFSDFGR